MSKKILLPSNTQFQNLTGKTYGYLLVVEYKGKNLKKEHLWLCLCKCGTQIVVRGHSLKTNNTKSCGCFVKEGLKKRLTTHGLSKTPEYYIWEALISRCKNPSQASYKHYGNRGIKVCKRWLKFENFYKDMGPRPSNKHEIDRKDNDKGYYPSNCRWVTRSENSRNTSKNVMITYDNKTKCLTDWAVFLGINRNTLNNRLNRGWDIETAFTKPVAFKSNP